MRIATLVIGLGVALIVLVQSCAALVGESLAEEETGAGGAGLIVAVLFISGAGFALTHPRVSAVLFVLAALIAFPVGATSDFSDLIVWGVVALILAALEIVSYRRRPDLETGAATVEPPV